ncbi:MAG: anhydro-N-acetylmuramic acid kinase [Bryobacteraceae bacterium]
MKVAGIMSGTSLDGIDVAVVQITPREANLEIATVASHTRAYPDAVRAALLSVSNAETHTRAIARLHFLLPQLYAEAFFDCCRASQLDPADVALIGCHGQTIYHEGRPADVLGRKVASTLQIGDGSVLAELTATTVVSDFRPRDIAAGGQGAPLVPFVDWLLFRNKKKGRAPVNIGGIANLTLLAPNCSLPEVLAFDTGPGNLLIDQLAAHFSDGAKRCDQDGAMGRAGLVNAALLSALMQDDFYHRPPPKSAGREQYGAELVQQLIRTGLSGEDLVATVTRLTAVTIAEAIFSCVEKTGPIAEVIVSGGGVHNPFLMECLREELPRKLKLSTTAAHGVDPDFKEAIAFAVLAYETSLGRASSLPSATGACHSVVLGKISY